jgi:hypothetical protein
MRSTTAVSTRMAKMAVPQENLDAPMDLEGLLYPSAGLDEMAGFRV